MNEDAIERLEEKIDELTTLVKGQAVLIGDLYAAIRRLSVETEQRGALKRRTPETTRKGPTSKQVDAYRALCHQKRLSPNMAWFTGLSRHDASAAINRLK